MEEKMKVMGVVGSGQMGSGIAQLGVMDGLDVWLVDTDPDALGPRNLLFVSIMSFGWLRLSPNLLVEILLSESLICIPQMAVGTDAPRRLRCTSNLKDLHSADIIVEAIVESEDVKKKLFSELDKITKASAILASNTSSISITRLASATSRPCQVIGMHFMNPPPLMKLVEVIRGADTSDETFRATKALAERFGKTVVCSQDYAGFIVNRILMPMINEAFFTLYTGVATKEDIDAGMKLGTNQPMGPLQLADFIGLDVCLSIMKVLHTGLGDSKYAPCPLLVQYVDAGRLGKKRGIGVFDYRRVPESVKPNARL
ncbi:3-hydroxyacyl-CoA dehydrogenase family protein [Citrus sinensis]|uniref:3-hydroxyacyl-CoA dehydrogenase family protein n=1 Tax=Citrus sinensis TaxID=2711 RepID=A0ACB8NXL7_CITSI|nr:3-hydroxyacyl-CoA dehydrogenase family protein [Citrus sinensis]